MGTVHARVRGPAAAGRDTRAWAWGKGGNEGVGAALGQRLSGREGGGDLPKVIQWNFPW